MKVRGPSFPLYCSFNRITTRKSSFNADCTNFYTYISIGNVGNGCIPTFPLYMATRSRIKAIYTGNKGGHTFISYGNPTFEKFG